MGKVLKINTPPTLNERVQMTHETEIWEVGDEEFATACSCGWDTGVLVRIRTEADANEAADKHREAMALLHEPSITKVVMVYMDHGVKMFAGGGGLECSCGEWRVKGYPIGHDTALHLWKIHFAQELLKAVE